MKKWFLEQVEEWGLLGTVIRAGIFISILTFVVRFVVGDIKQMITEIMK